MREIIRYTTDVIPDANAVIELYANAGLKRPVDDKVRIEKMFANSNLIVTAWHNEILVGVSRAMTDYSYWCYLADLAVHPMYQRKGIGRNLIEQTKIKAGKDCMLVLLSAPSALSYYSKIGLRNLNNGFAIDRET